MHHWGSEAIDLSRVGFAFDALPGGSISLSNLVPVQQVARVLKEPWEEVVSDRQFFSASLLEINQEVSSPFP